MTPSRNKYFYLFLLWRICVRGQDSSVGIATRYGLEGSGIESRWGARFSARFETVRGSNPASYLTFWHLNLAFKF